VEDSTAFDSPLSWAEVEFGTSVSKELESEAGVLDLTFELTFELDMKKEVVVEQYDHTDALSITPIGLTEGPEPLMCSVQNCGCRLFFTFKV